jgi:hypothetical protein
MRAAVNKVPTRLSKKTKLIYFKVELEKIETEVRKQQAQPSTHHRQLASLNPPAMPTSHDLLPLAPHPLRKTPPILPRLRRKTKLSSGTTTAVTSTELSSPHAPQRRARTRYTIPQVPNSSRSLTPSLNGMWRMLGKVRAIVLHSQITQCLRLLPLPLDSPTSQVWLPSVSTPMSPPSSRRPLIVLLILQ